jgi:amino acid permease
MNLNTVWGIVGIAILQFILGTVLLVGTTLLLPQTLSNAIANNTVLHTLFLSVFFAISFSIVIFVFRRKVTDKSSLAKRFFLLYFVLYIFSPLLNHDPTSVLVAIVFPSIAFFLARLIV